MKELRDQNRRAYIVKDKLYVDGRLYIPPEARVQNHPTFRDDPNAHRNADPRNQVLAMIKDLNYQFSSLEKKEYHNFGKYLKKSGSFNFDIKPQTFKQHILNNDGLLVLLYTKLY
jgi:hypothetical protein